MAVMKAGHLDAMAGLLVDLKVVQMVDSLVVLLVAQMAATRVESLDYLRVD